MNVTKIISGGQTGADRAGLDFALEKGIPCGGYCPKGRIAEDGPIDVKYPLTEMASKDYLVRTKKNVQEADGTIIFTLGPLGRGSKRTMDFCTELNKPCLWIDGQDDGVDYVDSEFEFGQRIAAWIEKHDVQVLNVAGGRESKSPGIHTFTLNVLRKA